MQRSVPFDEAAVQAAIVPFFFNFGRKGQSAKGFYYLCLRCHQNSAASFGPFAQLSADVQQTAIEALYYFENISNILKKALAATCKLLQKFSFLLFKLSYANYQL
jgi:hypothetical protein